MKSIPPIIILIVILLESFQVIAGNQPLETQANNSPVSFIKNQGQWNPEIIYKGSSTKTSVSLLNDGISFCDPGEEVENSDGSEDHTYLVWNMKFVNANEKSQIIGSGQKESKLSYLFGSDSSKWVIRPDEFSVLNYKNVYANVDLKFYGEKFDLKYDFVIHAGGEINSIVNAYEGVERLSINSEGELEVKTKWQMQVQRKPVAWQIQNGIKRSVEIQYLLLNDTTFGFVAPNGFNRTVDLIIDPLFQMVWSSYTNIPGGSNNVNYCFANAMDNVGNVYMTGMVDGTFPITPGAYSGAGSVSPEIFVAKFSSDGSTFLYGTYLPGNSSEFGTAIAVDDQGRAYLTGVVDLNITGITNYPSTANAYQPVHNSGSDAFLTVLNASGTGLVYSSFLGGTGSETGYAIALGGSGIAYVAGYTSQGNYPVVASQTFATGDNDVFVAKFDINQSGSNSLIYSTRIGGGAFSSCKARGIAVNSAGNVFITGTVYEGFGPLQYPRSIGAYNSVYDAGIDGKMAFVTKLSNAFPIGISYSTLIGPGEGSAIAVDLASDEVFISGTTYTPTFPITSGALQATHSLQSDAFVTKLNATGSSLIYSTFLGGGSYDLGTGLAINSAGEAYVSGITQDQFPTSPGAIQPANAGTYDFFVVNVNANGTGYGCGGSTYIGGSDADYSGSFYDFPSPKISILDHGGFNDTILISSTSHSQNFPTTSGVYGPVKINGIADQPVFFKLTCASPGMIPDVQINSGGTTFCNDGTTDFFDMSANNPTSWNWYFPGATPSTSSLQNPIGISYSSQGSFDVILVACNSFGCDSTVFSNYISIVAGPSIPQFQSAGDTIYSSPAYAYQWNDGGIAIPGETNSFFVPSQDGVYTVTVFDSLGCSATSKAAVITDVASISSLESEVLFYPNPVSGNATITLNNKRTEKVTVKVFDISGQLVSRIFEEQLRAGKAEFQFDSEVLAKGIYILEVMNSEKLLRMKFVVK